MTAAVAQDFSVQELIDNSPTAGWILVWGKDPLGDCTCPRRGGCSRIGKHPWWRETRSGEIEGFQHGALDMVGRLEDIPKSWYTAGNRLAAVPGGDLMVLDLDTDRAWRTFLQVAAGQIPHSLVRGVCRTPRGWHIWIEAQADGWTAASCRRWMDGWLGKDGWGGMDIRTGDRSFVLWPGGRERYWVRDFYERVRGAYVAPRCARGNVAWGPPWLAVGDAVEEHQRRWSVDPDAPVEGGGSSGGDLDWAWEDFELALRRLARAVDGTRNNTLNACAYWQGAEVVWLNAELRGKVERMLMEAYWPENPGDRGGLGTIGSGLRAGLARLGRA